ncbi:MAG: hypothetical protein E6I46_05630 [Chloroflexi bacterium]|nr:MAG: hypothetical protein E6I46_05630 [Chloroflexota bacterium]
MRQRGSVAIEQLRRRGRLFARDLRLGHIGPGRRWPPYLRSAAITLILALATALVVAQNFLPNRLNLRAGDVSSQDVVSQRSVRYESQTKRDEVRAAAASQVPDQFDGSVSSQQRQAIDALATKVADLRRSSSSGPDRSAQLSLLEPQLSDAQRQYLLQADEGTVATVFKSAGDILQALEANGIKADTLKSAQDTAQTRAAALHLDSTGGSVVATLVRAYLKVNYLQAETDLKRQQASNAVPPVFVTVAQGQTIIRYGDLVTPFQLEEAQAVGLLAPTTDWARIMAVFMLVIILFAVALGYLMQFRPAILRDPRQLGAAGRRQGVRADQSERAVPGADGRSAAPCCRPDGHRAGDHRGAGGRIADRHHRRQRAPTDSGGIPGRGDRVNLRSPPRAPRPVGHGRHPGGGRAVRHPGFALADRAASIAR